MAKTEIVDTLTGRFVFRAKNTLPLEGYGTIVIRQEIMALADPLMEVGDNGDRKATFRKNVYYGSIYGKFRPNKASIIFQAQREALFETGGMFYQCALIKEDGKSLEEIGLAFACETLDDHVMRWELDGKVNYLIRNKFGSTGKIFAMGVRNRKR